MKVIASGVKLFINAINNVESEESSNETSNN